LKHYLQALRPGPYRWLGPVVKASDQAVIDECGLDVYLFLRFLKIIFLICGSAAIFITPFLVSVNVLTGRSKAEIRLTGLDQLGWGNINAQNTNYYWAHFSAAVVIVVATCAIILHELRHYVPLHHMQLSRLGEIRSWLVLISDVPAEWRCNRKLQRVYGRLSGLQTIWVIRNLEKPMDLIRRRNQAVETLEAAETALIAKCSRAAKKEGESRRISPRTTGRQWQRFLNEKDRELTTLPLLRNRWLPALPFLGTKVDKISHYQRTVAGLSREIHRSLISLEDYPATSSVLLEFADRQAALSASHFARSPYPDMFVPTMLETDGVLTNILWTNLTYGWWQRYLRATLISATTSCLTLFWVVPIAVAGSLSQISYLQNYFRWGRRISSLPDWLLSAIQGVAPQALSATLMVLFPFLLRTLVRQRGLFTRAAEELLLQKLYFAFLFLHLFFTVSVSSGLTAVLYRLIDNVRSIPAILAENLPKASNYFLSYLVLQACFLATLTFSQVLVFGRGIVGQILDKTPRQKWRRTQEMNSLQWGTLFPVYTNLACIGELYRIFIKI
jgi:Calcium-dependent channel, 7TM region, putative phosphate/Late exocytosis, associated with Golgi transport/Cytosolic domain of 10TM putative phosphate transporter